MVKAPLPVRKAILLFCTTSQARLGLPCGSTPLCGAQGLGGYKSTTPWDANSWTHFCVFSESSADRESGYADNNPSSPFFGRMYISWNDFNVACGAGGCIFVVRSTDGGVTWSSRQDRFLLALTSSATCRSPATRSRANVDIAGMNEFNGSFTNRANKIYRSTDGGVTWTNTYTGPQFPGPDAAHPASSPPWTPTPLTGDTRAG